MPTTTSKPHTKTLAPVKPDYRLLKLPPDLQHVPNLMLKVLAVNGRALLPCSGGNSQFHYSPPRKKKGVWEPGEWTPVEPVAVCSSGYHLTTRPNQWIPGGKYKIFWAQGSGRHNAQVDKVAWEKVRLLRPLQLKDHQCLSIANAGILRGIMPSEVFHRAYAILTLETVNRRVISNLPLHRCFPGPGGREKEARWTKKMLRKIAKGEKLTSRELNRAEIVYKRGPVASIGALVRQINAGRTTYEVEPIWPRMAEIISVPLRNAYARGGWNGKILFDENTSTLLPG